MKLATIITAYDEINDHIFDNMLDRPFIGFARWSWKMGEFWGRGSRQTRMRFNKCTTNAQLYPLVFHEMIHQYQYDILLLEDANHDETFWAFATIADCMDWDFGEHL